MKTTLKNLILAALFAAMAVLLSGFSIPVGPTRCFPFQHAINAISGVLLGPWWAAGAALTASIIRNALGTGTLFAFPGSIPGALVVGITARLLKNKRYYAALTEPLGTGIIGAIISVYILAPAIGKETALWLIMSAFLLSSVPGSLLGFALLLAFSKAGWFQKNIGRSSI